MENKTSQDQDNSRPNMPSFHQRFNIEVDLEEAKPRFVNRVLNTIDLKMGGLATEHKYPYRYRDEMIYVANVLGEEASGASPLKYYTGADFNKLLLCLEALYAALKEYKSFGSPWELENLDDIVKWALSISEVDLGIQWRGGIFYPSGAKLMDEELVNEPLKWLADPKYKNVLAPFRKGLTHYLEANRNPEKLADTVTDMYEALEAMAKVITGRDKDLSANRESFISRLNLSSHYKVMLKNHIEYANEYRHAAEPSVERKLPLSNEVEAFVYSTGLFIRLAIQQLDT